MDTQHTNWCVLYRSRQQQVSNALVSSFYAFYFSSKSFFKGNAEEESKLDSEHTNLEVVGVDSTELRPPPRSPPLQLPGPPGPDFQPMGA